VDPDAVRVTTPLQRLVRSDPWLLEALRAARGVDPPDWLVGGACSATWSGTGSTAGPGRLRLATWPETATAVAVRLLADDRIEVVAPCGLEDLFGLVCRRNPRRVTVEHYRQRVHDKRIAERWPRVEVLW
jgi:hypothetical protein